MKTQKEIEQLAYKYAIIDFDDYAFSGYIKGYTQCQEDIKKELYEFGKIVLDTFHSEGKTHSGKDRLARIKFDEWFNSLNKQD